MASVTPVTYAEFYRVVTNDPHDCNPSTVYDDEMPVHVGGLQAMPANIVSAGCGEFIPDAYLLITRG